MASIDNIIKFTQQVTAEFPDMEPGEQARMGARRAQEFEDSAADSTPASSKGSASIRSILEPLFKAGDYSITIDREAFEGEHGITLTYQNLRSAFRAYFTDTHRIVIRENALHFTVTREVKTQAAGAFDEQVSQAVQVERARVCDAMDELFGDSFRDRTLLKALKIIVRNGE